MDQKSTTEEIFYPEKSVEEASKEETTPPAAAEEKPEGAKKEETPEAAEKKEEEAASTEEKPTEEKQAEEEVEYTLELPKETFLDNSTLEDVVAFASEHKLSKEVAQKILSKQDEVISKFVEAEKEKHESTLKAWRQQVIEDTTYGGDNLAKYSEGARRVVDKFGSEGFKELLRDSGYGDHPEVFKFIAKIGTLMDNDSMVLSGASGMATKSTEEIFYGKSN